MQCEDAVYGALEHGVDHVIFAGHAEHHAQEIARIAQVVLWVHEGLAYTVFVGHGHQGRHLGDQADRCDVSVLWVVDVGAVVVEGRQSTNQTGQDGHRVGVTTKTAQKELHLLVDHGVLVHQLVKVFALLTDGQFTVQEQVAGVQIVHLVGQLLDGVTTVQEFAFVAIDVGDGGLA